MSGPWEEYTSAESDTSGPWNEYKKEKEYPKLDNALGDISLPMMPSINDTLRIGTNIKDKFLSAVKPYTQGGDYTRENTGANTAGDFAIDTTPTENEPTLREAATNIGRGLVNPQNLKETGEGIVKTAKVLPAVGESIGRGIIGYGAGGLGDARQTYLDLLDKGDQTSLPTSQSILNAIPRLTDTYEGAQEHEMVGGLLGLPEVPKGLKAIAPYAETAKDIIKAKTAPITEFPGRVKSGFEVGRIGEYEGGPRSSYVEPSETALSQLTPRDKKIVENSGGKVLEQNRLPEAMGENFAQNLPIKPNEDWMYGLGGVAVAHALGGGGLSDLAGALAGKYLIKPAFKTIKDLVLRPDIESLPGSSGEILQTKNGLAGTEGIAKKLINVPEITPEMKAAQDARSAAAEARRQEFLKQQQQQNLTAKMQEVEQMRINAEQAEAAKEAERVADFNRRMEEKQQRSANIGAPTENTEKIRRALAEEEARQAGAVEPSGGPAFADPKAQALLDQIRARKNKSATTTTEPPPVTGEQLAIKTIKEGPTPENTAIGMDIAASKLKPEFQAALQNGAAKPLDTLEEKRLKLKPQTPEEVAEYERRMALSPAEKAAETRNETAAFKQEQQTQQRAAETPEQKNARLRANNPALKKGRKDVLGMIIDEGPVAPKAVKPEGPNPELTMEALKSNNGVLPMSGAKDLADAVRVMQNVVGGIKAIRVSPTHYRIISGNHEINIIESEGKIYQTQRTVSQ